MNAQQSRIGQLQILRCIAAILVLFMHSIVRVDMAFPDEPESLMGSYADLRHWGSVGVDLFFVLSGFIMLYVTHKTMQKRNAQGAFLIKRFTRILPIYYLLTSLGVLLLIFAPELFNYREQVDVPWIIASYLFIPMTSVDGVSKPVLGLGWTLNYEMYFYVVFSFLLYFRQKIAVMLLSLFFFMSITLGILFPLDNLFYKQATNWMLLEFLFGIWLAYLYLNNYHFKRAGLVAGTLGLLTLLYTIYDVPAGAVDGLPGGLERMLWWGIPAALVVYAGLMLELTEGRASTVMIKLGDASYSIYLIQVFSLPALALTARKMGLEDFIHNDVMIALFMLLSVIAGYVFFLRVEQPSVRGLARLSRNS